MCTEIINIVSCSVAAEKMLQPDTDLFSLDTIAGSHSKPEDMPVDQLTPLKAPAVDQTTLLNSDIEAFTLEPIDVTTVG